MVPYIIIGISLIILAITYFTLTNYLNSHKVYKSSEEFLNSPLNDINLIDTKIKKSS